MKNVFERNVDVKSLRDKPLADFSPAELVAYLYHSYPKDPIGALKCLEDNFEIGSVLGGQTRLLLEGLPDAKRN